MWIFMPFSCSLSSSVRGSRHPKIPSKLSPPSMVRKDEVFAWIEEVEWAKEKDKKQQQATRRHNRKDDQMERRNRWRKLTEIVTMKLKQTTQRMGLVHTWACIVIDNSNCNSFASYDISEEDECLVCGGSYSTDTDDRKKAWIGCDGDWCHRCFHYWCVGYKGKPSTRAHFLCYACKPSPA